RAYAQNLMSIDGNEAPLRRNHDFELYFESDTLDQVYAKLEEAGIEWVHPMAEQPWGQRVIRFFDPDRHIIEIGEPLTSVAQRLLEQGMTVESVSAKTSLPIELVLDLFLNNGH
ncbi:MAG: VOC family protein, partial [Ignavibacteriales bacterium]